MLLKLQIAIGGGEGVQGALEIILNWRINYICIHYRRSFCELGISSNSNKNYERNALQGHIFLWVYRILTISILRSCNFLLNTLYGNMQTWWLFLRSLLTTYCLLPHTLTLTTHVCCLSNTISTLQHPKPST